MRVASGASWTSPTERSLYRSLLGKPPRVAAATSMASSAAATTRNTNRPKGVDHFFTMSPNFHGEGRRTSPCHLDCQLALSAVARGENTPEICRERVAHAPTTVLRLQVLGVEE